MIAFLRNKVNLVTTAINPSEEYKPSKKRVLVIHCHPVKESFSTAISNNVVDGLTSAGHEVRLRRLYFHGNEEECYDGKPFRADLSPEEWTLMNQPNIIEERSKGNISDKVLNEAVKDLRWASAIVFVYPTWWSNFPGMLKGYFDRVLVTGVAFKRSDKGILPNLKNIEKIGVVTTFGGSKTVQFLVGDNGRRFLGRNFRFLCAPQCNMVWHGMHEAMLRKPEEREQFLDEVKRAYSHF